MSYTFDDKKGEFILSGSSENNRQKAKYCHMCGISLPSGSNFCPKCGTSVVSVSAEPNTASSQSIGNSNYLIFTVGGVSFYMLKVGNYSRNFYMGETVVTQALWTAVMGSNPSHFIGSQNPVERVSWDDANRFISKLNSITGRQFCLPSAVEWELAACLNGKRYAGSDNLNLVAWYAGNSGATTHPVKSKRSNSFGLYDMTGNVWEWCKDQSAGMCEIRGGSWRTLEQVMHAAHTQSRRRHDDRVNLIGFRLALHN